MIIDAPKTEQIPALRALWREAFGDGEDFLDLFFKTAFSPNRCRVAVEGNELSAALYWFDCELEGRPVAYLYAIATAKEQRGKGICSALMANTHRHLHALGYASALLVPSTEALFAFYGKMGYSPFGGIGETRCEAAKRGVALRRVTAEEYACLRRTLLPKGGVIQEGESLRFLQGQVDLYAGDGFLLAARREADTLLGLELIGDVSRAPAIVNSLGCARGVFRHGGSKPFAMALPLDTQGVIPSYFGLAFD